MRTQSAPDTHYIPAGRHLLNWVAFFALTLLLLCLGVAAAAWTLIGSFDKVEAAAIDQNAMQVYRAFEADLRQLTISNRAYAQWDDAAEFLLDGNPRFIAANFVRETLTGMHVDIVLIADRDGRELYSCFMDRSSGTVVSPAPRESLRGLARFVGKHRGKAQSSVVDGIIASRGGLAAVSALEISRTDQTQPTGATMLFARYIDNSVIERVRETSHLPATITYLPEDLSAVASLAAPVRAWLESGGDTRPTFVLADNSSQISGYALVRSVDQHPIALFVTQSGRNIKALGYRTTCMMVAGIVAMFIAFGAAVFWLVRRLQRSFADQHSIEVRYRNIASQLREAIVLVDGSSFELLEANDAARKAMGCSRETLQTQTVQNLFPEITPAVLAKVVKDRADGTIHISRQRRDAEGWIDAEVNITCLDIQGRTVLTLVSHDVSHRKAAEERERDSRRQLAKIAQHDALTTLPNRLYLHARLPRILETIAVGGRLLALLYVDLDNFKNINDSLGHGQGDRLLQIVATRMRAAVSMHDLVARMGGDEFVVVAPLMPDSDAVDKLALRLRTAVSAPIALENATVTVTASLGIVIFPNDGSDVKTLLKHADIALYQAKEAGRDCHRFFSADMDLRVSEHLALEQALRHAVGTNQITMDYQPVIDLRTGQLSSLEALMRWRHPEREMIPPSQFIPVAEKSGLIVELGRQGLTRVIAQIRAWLDADVPIVPVAINVSPLQLERTDFAALVSELAGKAGIDPSWLRFEITESAVMKDPDRLVGTLQTLRDLGSQVLIDDFGTGYSSLSYLNRLPVDTVKIDRAFVRDLGTNCPHTPIVDAVIDIARKLGLKTVAEGVETAEQAALLREQGCDYAQGYFYSKPVSARQCRSLLRELERVRPLTETVMVRAIASG